MTDAEIEDVLCTIPSVHTRARALMYLYQLRDRLKQVTTQANALTGEATGREIVTWLRVTNAADTVRANYARKLADRIEAGEYKECPK